MPTLKKSTRKYTPTMVLLLNVETVKKEYMKKKSMKLIMVNSIAGSVEQEMIFKI